MAIDFLNVARSKSGGDRIVQAARNLWSLMQEIAVLNAVAGHCTDGVSYGQLETVFGLDNGKGPNFATLLGLINTILNTNTDVTGANRQSQLNEFVSRLSGQ